MLPPRALRPLGAVIAGLALWLAFPDWNLWWLAPIGVGLLVAVTRSVSVKYGALMGFATGLAFFIPALSWSGTYVGAIPWFALAIMQSLYIALVGAAFAVAQQFKFAPFVAAAIWTTGEWLRSTQPFGGFPWLRLGFSQVDAPWAPVVAWISTPGLTFLVALAGASLAALAFSAYEHRARGRRLAVSWREWSPALAVAAVIAIVGGLITPPTSGKQIRVAAVQGNVPTAGLEFNAQRRAVLDNHVKATETLAQQVKDGKTPRPNVVIWPENSSDIDPFRNADAGDEIATAVKQMQTPVIVGAVLQEPSPEVSNASLLYEPGRGVVDRYVKQHPVPFGEYIPYRSFFRMFSKKVDLVQADFTQGKKVGLFDVPVKGAAPAKLAPIICFEVAYDDLLRKPAERGAQMFVVQTNNATFGYSDESVQQLEISRLRALEYGRSVVHISTVGVSALITPDGVAHDKSSLFSRKVLNGELPLRDHATLAQKMGRAPEIAAAIVSLVFVAIGWRKRKSSGTLQR